MNDLNREIERRLARIAENEAQISKLVAQLWQDEPVNLQAAKDEELDLRQRNVILRREIADLRAKLPK
jgi:DNA topoisomerase IA